MADVLEFVTSLGLLHEMFFVFFSPQQSSKFYFDKYVFPVLQSSVFK